MTPVLKKSSKLDNMPTQSEISANISYSVIKCQLGLISNAKESYYLSNGKGLRVAQPEKWYKTIYGLATINDSQNCIPPAEVTEYLVEQLQQAFIKPWQEVCPTNVPDFQTVSHLLKDVPPPTPSVGQVKSTLRHLNPKKATGADGIPEWLLKRFYEELALVVHNVICASIVQCKYPKPYKHALICPVPKVNPPNDIDNDFRQISVLSQLAKVLEKLQLSLHRQDLMTRNNQHAFTQNRSTVSALTCISQKWFNATDNSPDSRMGVHALFLDFRKAFDMVDHGILLRKLAELNINKSLWLWIQSFLDGRSQQIKLNSFLSSVSSCPAGVPQGSVISPTLFNVHINDIEDSVPNSIAVDTHKYADDCTLDQSVKEGDVSKMQEVLNSIQTWADFNKMALNSKKTKDMWICFRDCISEPPPLTIGGETIERTSSFKLLGVWHQNTLKWNDHVKEITKKANRRMFCLRECRRANLPTKVGMTCYMTKIRPLLEYGSIVWGGIPQYLVDELESIQARSMRILGIPKDSQPCIIT